MKIRVGKNIYFTLTVLRLDNTPEDFTDARNIRLVINRKLSSYQFEPRLTIVDNVISFEFPASPQATTGEYEMHLSYEKLNDESVTGKDTYYLDCCKAFMLVDSTCKEDVDFSTDVPTVSLKGVIDRNRDGKDGVTPRIDPETKHWLIGFEDTGIVAEGKDGLTPYIGENGNWFIGDVDTGKPSRGKAFEYSDFTPEEIYELQEPARDMIESLNTLDEAVTRNEQLRIENETARVSSENTRKESENLRREAEQTRDSNEKTREAAESNRETAEEGRGTAELTRVESEKGRVSAESTRVENENARKLEEGKRDSAEKGRVDAETKRVAAEETRVTEFNRLKSESETATQNATTQANYAKEQGDNVAGTVEEIKTAQEGLETSVNDLTTVLNTQQGNRALYEAAGAVYNEDTGFYELNGLTDITEQQMRTIYIQTHGGQRMYNRNNVFEGASTIRTNLPFRANFGIGLDGKFRCAFINCTALEVAHISPSTVFADNVAYMFERCLKLKKVIGTLDIRNIANTSGADVIRMLQNCALLEDIQIANLKISFSFKYSPLISLESLRFIINNAANTSAITVTVHADVYAKIQDEMNTDWHALLAAAQEKQITFATA